METLLVVALASVGIVALAWGISTAMRRTRSGFRLYGREHVEKSVDELQRKIICPQEYETRDEVRDRKERGRVIADQIIAGRIETTQSEFQHLFKCTFEAHMQIDLDLAGPFDLLTPAGVLRGLITDLLIHDLPTQDKEQDPIECSVEDEQRISELERILNDLEASSDTNLSEQVAVILHAIEELRQDKGLIIRRAKREDRP